jgi:hypothetical protein
VAAHFNCARALFAGEIPAVHGGDGRCATARHGPGAGPAPGGFSHRCCSPPPPPPVHPSHTRVPSALAAALPATLASTILPALSTLIIAAVASALLGSGSACVHRMVMNPLSVLVSGFTMVSVSSIQR